MKFLFLFFILNFSWADCAFEAVSQKEVSHYNYLLVPGILNEFIPHYFIEYRSYLLNKGVPENQIFRVNVPSWKRPEVGKEMIKDLVLKNLNGKPWIFFSHSKGALETLYFLKDHEKDFPFQQAFLIQGALDGSSMYEVFENKKVMGWTINLLRHLVQAPALSFYVESFSPKVVRKNLEGWGQEGLFSKKIYLIESEADENKIPFRMKILAHYYKAYFNLVGDGVLQKNDHRPFFLREKQICSLSIEADHSELVKAAPWEKQKRQRIYKFIDTLLGLK